MKLKFYSIGNNENFVLDWNFGMGNNDKPTLKNGNGIVLMLMPFSFSQLLLLSTSANMAGMRSVWLTAVLRTAVNSKSGRNPEN